MRFANAFYFEIYFQSISITVLPQNSQVAARVAIVIAMQNSPCSANGGHTVHGRDSNLGPTALPATISLDVSAAPEFTLENQIMKQKEQTLLPALFPLMLVHSNIKSIGSLCFSSEKY